MGPGRVRRRAVEVAAVPEGPMAVKSKSAKVATKKRTAGGSGAKAPSPAQRDDLLRTLEERFERNMRRHPGVAWAEVRARILADAGALRSLHEMERTGGEPDVVARDPETGEVVFFDCSPESPAGRRSLCYDRAGLESRKEHRPAGTAVDTAAAMGIELLTEEEYYRLQTLGDFDGRTSSWVRSPPETRRLGGALACERRYGRVFTGHNGAQSYYAVRGFRGSRRV
jgi:hypothetical protein